MTFKNNKIDLFGTIYNIKYVDTVEDSEGNQIYGLTDSSSKIIYIAKSINDNKIKDNEIELTLLHELMHAILMSGQYLEYNMDEPLVEWLARCIYQLIKKNII